jgi:membrane protein DedA with SNARE-associated domain
MEAITVKIEYLITVFGALGVFLASVIEEVVIFIPSTLIQVGAGFLILSDSQLNFVNILKLFGYIVVPASLGVTIGSLVIYFLAYYGGDSAIKSYGKYFLINYDSVNKSREKILKNKNTFFFMTFLRFIPLFPNTVVTVMAGLLKMNLKDYIYSTFLGMFVRVTYLGAVGWLAVKSYEESGIYKNPWNKALFLAGVIVLITLLTKILIKLCAREKI